MKILQSIASFFQSLYNHRDNFKFAILVITLSSIIYLLLEIFILSNPDFGGGDRHISTDDLPNIGTQLSVLMAAVGGSILGALGIISKLLNIKAPISQNPNKDAVQVNIAAPVVPTVLIGEEGWREAVEGLKENQGKLETRVTELERINKEKEDIIIDLRAVNKELLATNEALQKTNDSFCETVTDAITQLKRFTDNPDLHRLMQMLEGLPVSNKRVKKTITLTSEEKGDNQG